MRRPPPKLHREGSLWHRRVWPRVYSTSLWLPASVHHHLKLCPRQPGVPCLRLPSPDWIPDNLRWTISCKSSQKEALTGVASSKTPSTRQRYSPPNRTKMRATRMKRARRKKAEAKKRQARKIRGRLAPVTHTLPEVPRKLRVSFLVSCFVSHISFILG
nr:uncharacterized protein LOC129382848 [Dermacentor andersoni]